MKTKDIIESGYKSFESLIKVIKQPINFEKLEDHQYKGVLEGRYEAFIVAGEQLNQIKDLEDQESIFDKNKYNKRIQDLIDSTKDILKQIDLVLTSEILVDEIDDEKFKAVVQAKKVGFNFLNQIKAKKDDMEFTLKNAKSDKKTSRNFATDRVKHGR